MFDKSKIVCFIFVIVLCVGLTGCSITLQTRHRSDIDKIESMGYEIDALSAKMEQLQQEKDNELSELESAKRLLEDRLQQEINDKTVSLEMAAKGLTIVFLTEILFDAGKASIKENAYGALDKVADVLKTNIADRNIGIEGHTDNQPIKRSGWKSNWELSTARATSVLHYLVDKKGIEPRKVSATGYGEYRTVASNDSEEGRRKNRRVEIVIIPKNMEKIDKDMQDVTQRKLKLQKQINKYKK
jgi:chemotaxis protein MotB